jgi:hypothetical protein
VLTGNELARVNIIMLFMKKYQDLLKVKFEGKELTTEILQWIGVLFLNDINLDYAI